MNIDVSLKDKSFDNQYFYVFHRKEEVRLVKTNN